MSHAAQPPHMTDGLSSFAKESVSSMWVVLYGEVVCWARPQLIRQWLDLWNRGSSTDGSNAIRSFSGTQLVASGFTTGIRFVSTRVFCCLRPVLQEGFATTATRYQSGCTSRCTSIRTRRSSCCSIRRRSRPRGWLKRASNSLTRRLFFSSGDTSLPKCGSAQRARH